ncbi:MAG: serine/threonine protein kinase [Myxococcales bacterium]|nr:serine/threonine protein kinase [Myxococcales bacterium]
MAVSSPISFGPWLLLDRIGMGGTAEVFRAARRGRRPGEPDVAVKRLLPHLAADPAVSALFLREVEALERIDHHNVVQLLAHGDDGGLPWLAMPLLDGGSLRDVLQAPLPPVLALHVAAEVAAGLGAAHRLGIVHRDVSPTNVQITAAGAVQVLDFGIARVAGLAQTTHGRGLRGKWPYLSPEQIAGLPLDGRSDLFALGSVIVEMLAGAPPFLGADRHETLTLTQAAAFGGVSTAPASIAGDLNALLHQLFARTPQGRPASAEIVVHALGSLRDTAGAPELDVGGASRIELGRRAVGSRSASHSRVDDAAELRGEVVTDPAVDPDITLVADDERS